MRDDVCVVEVGIHPGPYFRDGDKMTRDRTRPWVVCSRHRSHYEERADEFGPFDWRPFDPDETCPECGLLPGWTRDETAPECSFCHAPVAQDPTSGEQGSTEYGKAT